MTLSLSQKMATQHSEQIRTWSSESDADIELLTEIRAGALVSGLEAILKKDPSPLHRIVIEANQNGTMAGYAETLQSHEGFVERFRSECNWDAGIVDDELYKRIGSWHFASYKYGYFEVYSEGVEDAEYDFWEAQEEIGEGSDCYHNASVMGAILKLENSDAFSQREKSDDFELRFYDGNCYEWEADAWLKARRTKG